MVHETNCGTPDRRSDHKFWTKRKCETTTATTATATSITQTTTTTLPANAYPLGAFEVNAACPRGSCGGKACSGELEFGYLTAPDGSKYQDADAPFKDKFWIFEKDWISPGCT